MSDGRAANDLDRKIGARVRVRRLEIDVSQERLAELLGVTFQQVQKYEKGVNRISCSRLADISRALDYPIARFFDPPTKGVSKAGKGVASLDEALAVPDALDLVVAFGKIESPRTRKRIVELVRTMADERATA